MPLTIDYGNELIKITSPTTNVDGQVLHDFIEDNMATPEGSLYADIIQPEGKIEDPSNPGVFSQIIIILNSPWQVQFWGGSGYTRIYGAKLVGGLADQPMKATGAAGDITVLESPVDGLTVVSGSGVTEQDKTDITEGVWAVLTSASEATGTFGELMKVLVGMNQQNYRIRDQVYANFGTIRRMTSAKIRLYEGAVDTIVDQNNYKQYNLTANYNGSGDCTAYYVVEGEIEWYAPVSVQVSIGSIESGELSDVYADDGNRIVVAETTSSPAWMLDFYFTSVPDSALQLTFNGHYNGNPTHDVKLYQYNYNTTVWDAVTIEDNDFPSNAVDQDLTFELLSPNSDYINGGELRLRMSHDSPGNPVHRSNIDLFKLDYYITTTTSTSTSTSTTSTTTT